jgi:hypothetical protein
MELPPDNFATEPGRSNVYTIHPNLTLAPTAVSFAGPREAFGPVGGSLPHE